jgi:hypothetical protein
MMQSAGTTFQQIFTELMVRHILTKPDVVRITDQEVRDGIELVQKLRERAQVAYDASKRKDRAPFSMFAYVMLDLILSEKNPEQILGMTNARLEALVLVRRQQMEIVKS